MHVLTTDRRLLRLREALVGHLDGDVPDELPDPADERMEAAVALVIRATDPLDFLLIKRATSERDRWSGQMALPGGRWDPTDPGLLHTARRETLEETGIDLFRRGWPLGRLDDVSPTTNRLPRMRIAPYVFGVPADTEARVASAELESVHWVEVDALLVPDSASTIKVEFPEFSAKFPSYNLVGEHVWGLTHRILTRFVELYPTLP